MSMSRFIEYDDAEADVEDDLVEGPEEGLGVDDDDDDEQCDEDFQDAKDEYPDEGDEGVDVEEVDDVVEEPKEDTLVVLLNRVRQRQLKTRKMEYDFVGSPLEKE